MNLEQTKAWMRTQGVSEEQITRYGAEMDQTAAAVDDMIVWALRAKQSRRGEEVIHASLHITALLPEDGRPYALPILEVVHTLTARCADTVLELGRMEARIQALEAENERLRRGR